jgi:integrase
LHLRGDTLVGDQLNTVRRIAEVSPLIASVTADDCRTAVTVFATNGDGTKAKDITQRNRRQGLTHLLGYAVDERLITANPLPPIVRKGQKAGGREGTKGKAGRIGTKAQVAAVLVQAAQDAVGQPQWRADCVALLWLIYATGCRPSEALGLTAPDVGEHVIHFSTSYTEPGAAWTDGGGSRSAGPLKHRAEGTVRTVPVMIPAVVEDVQTRAKAGGRLYEVKHAQLDRVWREARTTVSGGLWGTRLARPYDLRHQWASLTLNAGISVVEVARRLGNSPAVVLTTYADVIVGDVDKWNGVIAAALDLDAP